MPLTDAQLRALISAPEDAYLERKPENVKREELRRTIVAFANFVTEGREAVLFLGLGDRGEVLGVQNTDRKQKEIRRVCEEDCYPPIAYQPRVLEVNGVHIIAVIISESQQRPHFAGPAYVRRGSESIIATRELYEDLIASRHEKCRVIQRWLNMVITVLEDRYRLDHGRVPGEWRASRECMVLGCDAHTVRLKDQGSDNVFRVSLRQVEIGFDESRHRHQLTVGP